MLGVPPGKNNAGVIQTAMTGPPADEVPHGTVLKFFNWDS
jgi:hypothetical protein